MLSYLSIELDEAAAAWAAAAPDTKDLIDNGSDYCETDVYSALHPNTSFAQILHWR